MSCSWDIACRTCAVQNEGRPQAPGAGFDVNHGDDQLAALLAQRAHLECACGRGDRCRLPKAHAGEHAASKMKPCCGTDNDHHFHGCPTGAHPYDINCDECVRERIERLEAALRGLLPYASKHIEALRAGATLLQEKRHSFSEDFRTDADRAEAVLDAAKELLK